MLVKESKLNPGSYKDKLLLSKSDVNNVRAAIWDIAKNISAELSRLEELEEYLAGVFNEKEPTK